MNIAYICTDFGVPIFGYKGASIHVREMVAAFRRDGHNVHIISPAMNRGKEDEKGSNMGEEGLQNSDPFTIVSPPPEVDIKFDPELGSLSCLSVLPRPKHLEFIQELRELDQFLETSTRIRHEIRNLLYNTALFNGVADYLKSQKIDMIYERYTLFDYAGIKLARTLGVPHILEVNAPLAYEQKKMRGLEMRALAKKMEKRIYQESDHVLVVSKELKEFVQMCGVVGSRVSVSPNAVDPARFGDSVTGKKIRNKYHLADKTVVGFVGSLKSWHGTETLLQAFKSLHSDFPHLHVLIVGDGPERKNLENLAERSGMSPAITFTGKIKYGDIPQYLGAMDIAVAPYIPNDNFYFSPIKIFEYMAMGKAVIGAKIGQVQEIVRHRETGLLFEAGNINQLADRISTLAKDQRLRETLGKNARQWVFSERTWDNNAKKVIDIAREIGN